MYPETTRMGVCRFTSTKISSHKVKVEYKNKCIQLSPLIRFYFDLFVTLNLMIAQNVRALARVNDIPVINPKKSLWTVLCYLLEAQFNNNILRPTTRTQKAYIKLAVSIGPLTSNIYTISTFYKSVSGISRSLCPLHCLHHDTPRLDRTCSTGSAN